MLNALSVDIEDYYHVSAAEDIIEYRDWDRYESRVVNNTRKVLSLLKEFDSNATFFVLGWIAERFPALVKEIHSQGHEIACHGYSHRLSYEQGPDVFREDVRKAKRILEENVQIPIVGYRAPSCSITDKSSWALEILAEEGFQYDSSIFPIRHTRYGIPKGERFIHRIDFGERCSLIEFPMSTIRVLGANFAICGGGYLRLYPFKIVRWGIERINKEGHPAMVYFHPWEIDPDQPRMALRGPSRFRHYVNLSKHLDKLKRLLSETKFLPIKKVIDFNAS